MSIREGSQRLLFVHAHPDDETLATGVALAAHTRAGDDVHVLTCTLGQEGEVIPPELGHLTRRPDELLAPYRRDELRRAMARVGVHEHVLGESGPLGGSQAFRDSGMVGTAANADPRSFCAAPLDVAASAVRAWLEQLAPDIVVTYDEHGGYAHPDHIRTHEAVCAAVVALDPAKRPTLYGRFTPVEDAEADREWLRTHLPPQVIERIPQGPDTHPESVVPGDVVTHEIVAGPGDVARRDAALCEHRTQVVVHDGWYTLSNDVPARLVDREGYALLDPGTGRPRPGPESVPRRRGLLTTATTTDGSS